MNVIKRVGFLGVAIVLIIVADYTMKGSMMPDSSWYDGLPNPDSANLFGSLIQHRSQGLFPQPYRFKSWAFQSTVSFNQYEYLPGDALRSSSFSATTYPFSKWSPYTGDEEEIAKPNSSETDSPDLPSEGFTSIGLAGQYSIPWLSSILRGALTYETSRTRWYANDTSRSFLSLSGVEQPFKEVNSVFVNQHFITLSAGLMIPIYGIFVQSQPVTASSYYYIYGGVQCSGRVLGELTQYVQIANAKNSIRYRNGQDTLNLIDKGRISTAAVLRYNADVAIGWKMTIVGFGLGVELFSILPLNTVLTDSQWRQYRFGLRFVIGRDILRE